MGAMATTRHPRLEIEYCTQCRWLLRAAWTAQELLTTFRTELGEVALIPGTGGVFEVRLDQSGCGRAPTTAGSPTSPPSSARSATASLRTGRWATPSSGASRPGNGDGGPAAARAPCPLAAGRPPCAAGPVCA